MYVSYVCPCIDVCRLVIRVPILLITRSELPLNTYEIHETHM